MANSVNNKRIQVGELDFDAIKSNLKNFLKGQAQFSDYDFEGSNLSILLDILAYNTHYNGLYTNLAVNEMFIDSASKRSSVVSLAKMLGYTPRSAKCATAVVNATIIAPTSSPDVATIAAGQPFHTTVDNVSYTFYNQDAVTVAQSVGGGYTFTGLTLREGTPLQFKYTVADGVRFIIPNANVDLDTLSVQVQETATSALYETYTVSDNITEATATTKLYWVKEIDDGLYELTFGNGVIGKSLQSGNVVTINYYVSSLDKPNGAKVFTYNGSSILGSNLSVVATTPAYGGSVAEDLDGIKFNAPRHYAAQDRCVTTDDYKTMILSKFPQAKTVQVWGGEDGVGTTNNLTYSNSTTGQNIVRKAQYGKVYICIKPKDAVKLTNQQKEAIVTEILAPKNIVSVTPEIIDPEYFDVKVTTYVHYNPRATSKTPAEIETVVKNAIMAYNENDLTKFDAVLRYSKLCRIIDEADESIINNITTLVVSHPHAIKYNKSSQYVLDFINPISQEGSDATGPAFYSTGFYIAGSSIVHYLEDDFKGNVRLYHLNSNLDKVIDNATIGTVDYAIGRVVVKNLNITALDGAYFEWIIKPQSYDVASALNQLVQIDPTTLSVNAIADNTINGDMQAGYNYTFNSIRS